MSKGGRWGIVVVAAVDFGMSAAGGTVTVLNGVVVVAVGFWMTGAGCGIVEESVEEIESVTEASDSKAIIKRIIGYENY